MGGTETIARLMRSAGLQGVSRRKETTTMVRDAKAAGAPDLVQRDFSVMALDQLWVVDITNIPTWTGFLDLAIVLDAFSWRVVGWCMAKHLRTELILDALEMALWQRRPENVIHHSDHCTQYTSLAFGKRCQEAGIKPSVGDCHDNALAESFFATLECELLDRRYFRNHAEARMAMFELIESWYNPHRQHSSIDYHSPMTYEWLYHRAVYTPQLKPVHENG